MRLAAGDADRSPATRTRPDRATAIEVRVYAEDPARTSGRAPALLTDVRSPEGVRVDTWVETGTEVTPFYDPLLAKVIVHAGDRAARDHARWAPRSTTRGSTASRRTRAAARRSLRRRRSSPATVDTSALAAFAYPPRTIEVVERRHASRRCRTCPAGSATGTSACRRAARWTTARSRSATRCSATRRRRRGSSCTATGPTLRFRADTTVCAGRRADCRRARRRRRCPGGRRSTVAGRRDPATSARSRARACAPTSSCAAGSTCPRTSAAGRRSRSAASAVTAAARSDPATCSTCQDRSTGSRTDAPAVALRRQNVPDARPGLGARRRSKARTPRPSSSPPATSTRFYATEWQVHYNSRAPGCGWSGPSPTWARADGGEAGLHPSNIHDTALRGRRGRLHRRHADPARSRRPEPRRLRVPGDRDEARAVEDRPARARATRSASSAPRVPSDRRRTRTLGRVDRAARDRTEWRRWRVLRPRATAPAVCYRRCGDGYLLVEYGPMILDLGLRFRVHALADVDRADAGAAASSSSPPASGRCRCTSTRTSLPLERLVSTLLRSAEDDLPSRRRRRGRRAGPSILPLSWDDPATREAIERYMALGARRRALVPLEHRVHPPHQRPRLRSTTCTASCSTPSYLVLGLGDVYLGAPVATPLDPRHRLVTTKYNPARTWTPENAVGIGGAYLCIYGMEGPGRLPVRRPHRAGVEPLPAERPALRARATVAAALLRPDPVVPGRRGRAAGHARRVTCRAASSSPSTTASSAAPTTSGRSSAEDDDIAAFRDGSRRRSTPSARGRRAASSPRSTRRRSPFDGASRVGDGLAGRCPSTRSWSEAPAHVACGRLDVAVGDVVAAGAVLVAMEAMKPEIVGARTGGRDGAPECCVATARSSAGAPLLVLVADE